jgi:hypothetical protein
VVVVVVAGGAVVVVVGAGGGEVVTVTVGAFDVRAVSAGAVLLLLLLGAKLATVAFVLPGAVEAGTPPGEGLAGVGVGVLTEPPLLLAVPEPLRAGLEKAGINGPGAPIFPALSVGALTVPVLTATTASESTAAATLTVATKRFLTIPAALGPMASAIAEPGTRPNGSGSCLPKFLDAKTSSRVVCGSMSGARSGFERCIPPPVDWRCVQGLLRWDRDPRNLRHRRIPTYRDGSQRGTNHGQFWRNHRKPLAPSFFASGIFESISPVRTIPAGARAKR